MTNLRWFPCLNDPLISINLKVYFEWNLHNLDHINVLYISCREGIGWVAMQYNVLAQTNYKTIIPAFSGTIHILRNLF